MGLREGRCSRSKGIDDVAVEAGAGVGVRLVAGGCASCEGWAVVAWLCATDIGADGAAIARQQRNATVLDMPLADVLAGEGLDLPIELWKK
jgi:hypothetical protein